MKIFIFLLFINSVASAYHSATVGNQPRREEVQNPEKRIPASLVQVREEKQEMKAPVKNSKK